MLDCPNTKPELYNTTPAGDGAGIAIFVVPAAARVVEIESSNTRTASGNTTHRSGNATSLVHATWTVVRMTQTSGGVT